MITEQQFEEKLKEVNDLLHPHIRIGPKEAFNLNSPHFIQKSYNRLEKLCKILKEIDYEQ